MIDLRSDTVTLPDRQMREVMAVAEVGDDVMGEDPTVRLLEQRTAEILGKEAALYMASGTMSNQVAIRCHTTPGDEVMVDADAHSYFYESGAIAALSGVTCKLLPSIRGIFTAEDVKNSVRPKNIHFPPAKLVCIENTHNRGGGSVWPLGRIAEVAAVAREENLKLHLDGARLWNASAAMGVAEGEYAKYFDTVSVCFSKGLGAPVGSALAGGAEVIDKARRFRKQFGGGMRQAGIIAAGALYALEHNRDRLVEDHANAKELAKGIAALPGVELDLDAVETNIVIFRTGATSPEQLCDRLQREGVLVFPFGHNAIRAVTHLGISNEQIKEAIRVFRKALK